MLAKQHTRSWLVNEREPVMVWTVGGPAGERMMGSRRMAAVAVLGLLCGIGQASAQDAEGSSRQNLNRVLAVLRLRMPAAGRKCLAAMEEVHRTEDQVTALSRNGPGTEDKPNPSLDIARDVLGSDYDTATAACAPDAVRACQAPTGAAMLKACGNVNPGAAQ